MNDKIKILTVTGPTATGKTSLAVRLAREFAGEIVSADSRQVYRGLDIGSGKDLSEYGDVPYHLIDIADPGTEEYNLKEFSADVMKSVANIASRGALPVICGGSALYVNAVLRGYELPGGPPDTDYRNSLKAMSLDDLNDTLKQLSLPAWQDLHDKENPNRLIRAIEKIRSLSSSGKTQSAFELVPLVIAPYYTRAEVHERIKKRLEQRFGEGMIDEVKALHEKGVSWEKLEYFGLEYRYIAFYLQGKLASFNELKEQLLAKIRGFAKSQDIWFRKMEREGLDIYWIRAGDFDEARSLVTKFLAGEALPPPALRLKDILYGPQTQ